MPFPGGSVTFWATTPKGHPIVPTTASSRRFARVGILLAAGLTALSAAPVLAATKNRANGPCPKVGATATISGKPFVCTTVLGKRIWQIPPAPTTAAPVATTALPAAKVDAWEDIVEKAKKEGKVTLYSSQNPAFLAEMGEKFKAKYGITLEVFRDIDNNIVTKVEAEKQTGKGIADVLAQAGAPWQVQRDAEGGWFVPPVGPNFSAATFDKSKNMSKSGNYFTSSAAILTFGWNTKLFPKGMRDYTDALDPSLGTGRVGIIEPANAAITDFYLYLEEKYGTGFLAKLSSMRPRIYVSSLPMAQALTSGEISVGLFVAPLITEKAAGAPVDWALSDTIWGARFNTAILKTAPHPNAAQVLADFMLTKEAQEAIAKNSGSLLPGIGIGTTDRVRVQAVDKLTPAGISAFQERWRILFG